MKGIARILILTFVLTACKPSISSKTDIIIVPLGDVPQAVVDSIQGFLAGIYRISPQQITAGALPKNAFINVKSPRYRADSLLVFLKQIRTAGNADFAFGITAEDISTTKKDANGETKKPAYKYQDWGIMGLAFRPGREAIVSTFRLGRSHPKFYKRLEKVCIHEFGHNLGLPHCPDKNCVMTDAAESIKTVDACASRLCKSCARKAF